MIGPSDSLSSVSLEDQDVPFEVDRFGDDETLMINSPLIDELSVPHVGNWHTLVSRTNWEKGTVIRVWREALIAAELPKTAYSDEAWARRVGNVTSQHVGRLRRVSERFGEKANDFPSLYWSHFQAAMDWDDAEMWLEGAVQNAWSVAQMRVQRWEAIGAPEELKPRAEDVFTAELDDDIDSGVDSPTPSRKAERTEVRTAEIGPADMVEGFDPDLPPFETDGEASAKKEPKKSKEKEPGDGPSTGELLASLKSFADLPQDLGESLESLKVAILNHKLGDSKDWKEKLLRKLDALKALVTSVDE